MLHDMFNSGMHKGIYKVHKFKVHKFKQSSSAGCLFKRSNMCNSDKVVVGLLVPMENCFCVRGRQSGGGGGGGGERRGGGEGQKEGERGD